MFNFLFDLRRLLDEAKVKYEVDILQSGAVPVYPLDLLSLEHRRKIGEYEYNILYYVNGLWLKTAEQDYIHIPMNNVLTQTKYIDSVEEIKTFYNDRKNYHPQIILVVNHTYDLFGLAVLS